MVGVVTLQTATLLLLVDERRTRPAPFQLHDETLVEALARLDRDVLALRDAMNEGRDS